MPEIKGAHIAVLLAMSPASPSDCMRVRELLRQNRCRMVYTVAECPESVQTGDCRWQHTCINFQCERGVRSLLRLLRHVRDIHTDGIVTVMLDFYWLQSGYFAARYGLHWMSTTRRMIEDAGVDCVILPVDASGEMRAMLECAMPYSYVPPDACMLHQCSRVSGHPARSLEAQMRRLHPQTPFVGWTRTHAPMSIQAHVA